MSPDSLSSEAQGKGGVDIELSLKLAQREPVGASGAQADIAPTGGYIAWMLGACRMPTVIGGMQTPRDTEAEVQSSIAVCECTMASQRYGA